MKLVLEDLTPVERRQYENTKGPLHPWTPKIDDRTGFSFCNICIDRQLRWGQNKSLHSTYLINEEIDFPWSR